MYSVSDEYINQLKQEIQERRLSGTIGNLTFDDEDVLAGSFSISGRCMPNTNLTYGSVEITTLKVTFFNDFATEIPRTTYKGLEIRPTVSLKVGESWESVPCGVFTVDEATWTEIGVTLTAYDNMAKFDRALTLSTSYGMAYDLLSLACEACNVTLGNTQAEIEAMPNGAEHLAIFAENDMETWRDLLYWTTQTLGGFATIDRSGELVIRQFGNDTGITLGTSHRFTGISLSDFITSYTGISVVNANDDTTDYFGAEIDTGLTMNLGSNPLLQDNIDTKRIRVGNILEELLTFRYTPFTCKMIGDVCFDLGDVIHYTGGVAANDNCCIMAYNYVFGKDYTAQGFGENPALASARSKADKNLSEIKSRTRSNVLEVRNFVNAEIINLTDNVKQTIMSLDFTTINETTVSIFHEIQLDCLSEDMSVEVEYTLGLDVISYHPEETWSEDGKHILTLMYFVQVPANKVYTWTVALTVHGGDAVIGRDNARASLQGQGLAAVDKWNGRLVFEENIPVIALPLDGVGVLNISENVGWNIQEPEHIGELGETMGLIAMDGTIVHFMGITDSLTFRKPLKEHTWGAVKEMIWGTLANEYTWG